MHESKETEKDMFSYSVPFKREKEEEQGNRPPNSHSLALSYPVANVPLPLSPSFKLFSCLVFFVAIAT